MKRTIKAYQLPPEKCDYSAIWRDLLNDEGRLWSVVTPYSKERGSVAGAVPECWTADFAEAFRALTDWESSGLSAFEWVDEYIDYTYYHMDTAEKLGVKKRPTLAMARAGAREVLRRYSDALDTAEETGRWPDTVVWAAALLSAVSGVFYVVHEIRGSSQGEWAQLVIPEDEQEERAEIEAKYFGEVKEWQLVDEDGEETFVCIWEWLFRAEKLQAAAEAVFGEEIEVKLYEFDGYEPRVPKYKEVC